MEGHFKCFPSRELHINLGRDNKCTSIFVGLPLFNVMMQIMTDHVLIFFHENPMEFPIGDDFFPSKKSSVVSDFFRCIMIHTKMQKTIQKGQLQLHPELSSTCMTFSCLLICHNPTLNLQSLR